MRELTCIGCPIGCALSVQIKGDEISVSGNACKRGEAYAKAEVTHPVRTLTSTVALENGAIARVSVKTRGEIPKEKLMDCMAEIRRAKAVAPVAIGSVIIANCAGTGVDVVATKSVAAV